MKLPFETWLEIANVPNEAEVAFKESVISYKAGAYRAGLLFAYVGTGLWLRHRLIAASCPPGMNASQWKSIQNELQDENTWDAKMFECTQRNNNTPIFIVDNHLREEFKYWKNRRNDCAHFKKNIIAASHVESFWLFLQSSIGQWVPNGSTADLVKRFARHFDPSLTPPHADIKPLIDLIPHAVISSELNDFFNSLKTTLNNNIGLTVDEKLIIIHNEILQSADPVAERASITWLLKNSAIIMELLRKNPSRVQVLSGHATRIRALWKNLLFENGRQDLVIFAALLRNNLIPPAEKDEAFNTTIEKLKGDMPNQLDENILKNHGFWDKFHEIAIINNKIQTFDWANHNAKLIAKRIKDTTIDEKTANILCVVFNQQNYPYELQKALKTMLAQNPTKMAELQSAAQKAGVTVPAALK